MFKKILYCFFISYRHILQKRLETLQTEKRKHESNLYRTKLDENTFEKLKKYEEFEIANAKNEAESNEKSKTFKDRRNRFKAEVEQTRAVSYPALERINAEIKKITEQIK